MQQLHYPTLIIGSGFAGRTVASYLPEGSFMLVERGEDRDHGETLRRYQAQRTTQTSNTAAQEAAYRSDLPWNALPRLSRWNYSRYAMVRGGASNWWGGKASRLSAAVHAAGGLLPWPFSHAELAPWYARAERRLNVAGDPAHPDAPAPVAMPGAAYWRQAFAPHFRQGYLYNTAINLDPASSTGQGLCVGRANCGLCREDAKARPDNIFPDHPALYALLAQRIEFDGARAVAVECFDGKQLLRLTCERLVLACNGIETPRLLARSALPAGVRRAQIGAFLQDHAHLELSCKLERPLLYGNAGGLSHVVVQELSGMYATSMGPLEVSALAVTHEPQADTLVAGMDLALLRQHGPDAFLDDLNGCFDLFCELEIPPQAGLRVDLDSALPATLDEDYARLIPVYDGIARELVQRLTRLGVTVLATRPLYRDGYGGHHFCGTTNCSDGPLAVVDRDLRLIGTDNVFISGAGVLPRAGGIAPTLALVALAERLGDHLAAAGLPVHLES